jgi:predicted site-specific integrase-resolvase
MSDLLTTKQACEMLGGIDKATLLRWHKNGVITPAYEPPTANGALLWAKVDIEALAAARA